MKKIVLIFLLLSVSTGVFTINGQDYNGTTPMAKKSNKRAWEIGVGASIYNLTRFSILDVYKKDNGRYGAKTEKKDVLWGGHIYVARELNDYLALDLQGFVGYTRDHLKDGKDSRWVIKPELGLQWRLGGYFNSRLIDPYFRASVGYMYKNFNIVYKGVENIDAVDVLWNIKNLNNKEGADRRHMVPLSVGGGVNMWLNDHVGIGIQCMYVIKPYKNVSNDVEGTVRWMWRFGGKSKAPVPEVRVVEIPAEPIEIIKEVKVYQLLYDLLHNIYFDFDASSIAMSSYESLDKIADIMKEHNSKKFLIIGYTDAVGADEYNLSLSERRAKSVYNALVDRGVDSYQLKYRGVGMKVAIVNPNEKEEVRQGDRRVGIEVIDDIAYWEYIK